VISSAVLALACVGAPGPSAAGEKPRVISPSPAMRLGFPVERWQADPAPPEPARRSAQCRRWHAAADSLGETYAGHALRHAVMRRHCPLLASGAESGRWDWPWSGMLHGSPRPLDLHRRYGTWSIRCARGAPVRRCALLHDLAPIQADGAGPALAGATTHFVVDRVRGREMLLWRLQVPPAGLPTVAAMGSSTVPAPPARLGAGSEVRYHVGRAAKRERFPMCTPRGCIMEARGHRSGAVATALANGTAVKIEIVSGSVPVGAAVLPAEGFEAALAELVRLRRRERHP
jgi:invasion protein IalB